MSWHGRRVARAAGSLASAAVAMLLAAGAAAAPVIEVRNEAELRRAVEDGDGGRTIQIEEGVYLLAAPLALKENTHLRGVGKKRVILKAAADFNMVFMASGSTFEGLTVDGDRKAAGILLHGGVHDCVIRDVIVASQATQGISLQKAYRNRIEDVTLIGNGHRGINVSDSSHDNLLRRIVGRQNIKADVLFGHGAHHNALEGAAFEAAGDAGEACPNLWIHAGAFGNTVSGVTMRASEFQNAAGRPGIVVWNARSNTLARIVLNGYRHGILIRATTLDSPYTGVIDDDTRDNVFSDIVLESRGASGLCAVELHAPTDVSWYGEKSGSSPADRRRVQGNLFANIVLRGFECAVRGPSSTADNDPGRIVGNTFSNVMARDTARPDDAFPGVVYR